MLKRIGILMLLTAALFVVFSMGCGKDKPEIPPPPPPDTTTVVPEPEPVEPPPPPPAPLELSTIHFDYDKYALTPMATEIMGQNAAGLAKSDYANVTIRIEGHCDERGSDEYNMALGEKRAAAARDYLISYGIDAKRISIISYGESRPVDPGHDETAWGKNRRDAFIKVTE